VLRGDDSHQEVAMKLDLLKFTRIALLLLTGFILWRVLVQPFSHILNLSILVGALLLVFPIVWLARRLLDQKPTPGRLDWITTFVHYAMLIIIGVVIIRAVITHADWIGWKIPIPAEIGLVLAIITGAAGLFSVLNLALKGLGAPFAIALSEKVAVDWMYAWTRNPMVLATLALLVSLGLWYQSALFVVWVLVLFTPALLFFVKVYEERELELRFGASYLEYKARTPMLFPRKPRG